MNLKGYMLCKCQSISRNVRSKGIDNCCGLYIRVYFRITPIDLIVNYKRRSNRVTTFVAINIASCTYDLDLAEQKTTALYCKLL